jgi:UDP-N-acetylmuramoyl-L-alanyl-D-glutamate--2,6-diaminopimelate ligase
VSNGREAFAWLCTAWHDFPSRSMTLIGVTGTDGKTTTSTLIYNILKAAPAVYGYKVGLISTVNAVIGDETFDTGLHTTTPDADEIQHYLAQMRDAGTTHCVLEVTSHGLAHHRVDGCEFDLALITNITHDHLDLHGSREAYRAAKARLFENLALKGFKTQTKKQAILNADDAYSFDYLRELVASPITYSSQNSPHCTIGASSVTHTPDGMVITAETPVGPIKLHSTFIGDYNVANILAAVSAGLALNLPPAIIAAGVTATVGVPGRMERIHLGQPFTAIVDFAHTPNALENVLKALRRVTRRRLIVVFGCAGERDAQKRPMMARVAATLADIAIFTAEDPRRESLDQILLEMQAGVPSTAAATILRIHDRGDAIQTACLIAQTGDVVVACGKGHEQSLCFATTEVPWDDREALQKAIRQLAR